MNENILFLILVPLFFFGIIAGLLYILIKNIKSRKGLKQFAKKNNWNYYNTISEKIETYQLDDLLSSSLYKLHKDSTIRVSNILRGKYNNFNFWFAFYKSSIKQGNSQTHISSEFNIFILPNENIDQELIMIYRNNLIKHLPIKKITEIIGKPLFNLEEKEIDWLLVSDISAFENLNISFANIRILRDIISKAHSILFYKGMLIYAVNQGTTLSSKKLMEHLENVSQLNLILGN